MRYLLVVVCLMAFVSFGHTKPPQAPKPPQCPPMRVVKADDTAKWKAEGWTYDAERQTWWRYTTPAPVMSQPAPTSFIFQSAPAFMPHYQPFYGGSRCGPGGCR